MISILIPRQFSYVSGTSDIRSTLGYLLGTYYIDYIDLLYYNIYYIDSEFRVLLVLDFSG